ncbi:MAG TPA: 16S rRNA (cytosine(1402)-N(4))-methyltransferase RsmH [Gemmatimonadales bacterium]
MAGDHEPVLAEEVLRFAQDASRAADLTVGGGGHASRLAACGIDVLAFDRDPRAVARVRERFPEVEAHVGAFAETDVIAAVQRFRPDFVLFDLGVSSHQLDDHTRGFSFRRDVPLDMRMDARGRTAADYLNTVDVTELAQAFRDYGDERRAAALARAVARRRVREPLRVSDDLVNAIREVLGARAGPRVFARVFQAVRIALNEELEQLAAALPAYRDVLAPGGVLAVIGYHSGEDRIVKHAFREWTRACVCPREQPACTCRGRSLGTLLTRRPIRPEVEEMERNPRARSARLRAFRVDASA